MSFYKNIENIKFSIFLRRGYKKKRKKDKILYSIEGGMGGSYISHASTGLYRNSEIRGGGKCPEEEHTTCSGGPTIIIVTSAVYGERYYL
jgi:hypothetical protein